MDNQYIEVYIKINGLQSASLVLQCISLVHVQKACLPVLLTLLSS